MPSHSKVSHFICTIEPFDKMSAVVHDVLTCSTGLHETIKQQLFEKLNRHQLYKEATQLETRQRGES